MRLPKYSVPLLVFVAALPAFCQDLVAVAPQAAKVEYEDARVRVVRLQIAANESLAMHDRPARVVIPLTPNDVRTTRADGTTSSVHADAGKAAWSGPGKRSVTNLAVPLENIVVELKDAKEAGKALTHPPDPLPAGYLDERFHHWLFENQYVRVYDVRIPPARRPTFTSTPSIPYSSQPRAALWPPRPRASHGPRRRVSSRAESISAPMPSSPAPIAYAMRGRWNTT